MDPDAALELLLCENTDPETRRSAAEGLNSWLARDGFEPDEWSSENSRTHLRQLCQAVLSAIPEDQPDALRTPLAQQLRAGRGGRFHGGVIESIFSKLTPRESRVLEELIKHREADARQDGARRQSQRPWKRP